MCLFRFVEGNEGWAHQSPCSPLLGGGWWTRTGQQTRFVPSGRRASGAHLHCPKQRPGASTPTGLPLPGQSSQFVTFSPQHGSIHSESQIHPPREESHFRSFRCQESASEQQAGAGAAQPGTTSHSLRDERPACHLPPGLPPGLPLWAAAECALLRSRSATGGHRAEHLHQLSQQNGGRH